MSHLTQILLHLFRNMGGVGLLILGILDSSFLFAPLGNDLLVVAVTARHHRVLEMLYYSAMSAVGSVFGCVLVDLLLRRAGEAGLERRVPARRFKRLKEKVNQNAGWALAVASVAPPPFPFTPVVMAASALQYPRTRLLVVVGIARMVRFTVLGVLALLFGERILRWAESDVVQGFLVGLIVVCVIGSIYSVYRWLRPPGRGRQAARLH